MDIFNNITIRKYFSCGDPFPKAETIAYEVVKAMQAPLKKGDRFLFINVNDQTFEEDIYKGYSYIGEGGLHPLVLRIPDHFQEKSPIEKKIALFHNKFKTVATFVSREVDKELRELVELARG